MQFYPGVDTYYTQLRLDPLVACNSDIGIEGNTL